MNRTIRLLPEAREEFDNAADWYEEKRLGLGIEFIAEVRSVFKRIAANPRIHSFTFQDVRKAVVARFPYVIIYREELDVVLIISVFHTSQDQSIWKDRLK